MYHLDGGPGTTFVKEELMLIPEDTELPPDYVQKCRNGEMSSRLLLDIPIQLR